MNLYISTSKYKKYLKYTLLIVFIYFVIHLVFFEIFARVFVSKNHYVFVKENLLKQQKEKLEIIALGDSHTQNGLNITSENFYNYGANSDSIIIEYFKFKNIVKNVPNLRILLLEADYHQFSYYTTQYRHFKQYANLIDEEVDKGLGVYPKPNQSNLFLYSLQENYSPILYTKLYEYFTKPNQGRTSILNNGVSSSRASWLKTSKENRILHAEVRINRQINDKYHINNKIIVYYEKIIRLALKNNIKVVLIRYPLSNEYLNLISDDKQHNIDTLYRNLQEKYNLTVIDNRILFVSDQSLFYDGDHLNYNGATILGVKIEKDLNK